MPESLPLSGSLQISGVAPALSFKIPQASPQSGSLTLSGVAPGVEIVHTEEPVPPGSLTLTGAAPGVSFKHPQASPGPGSLTITGIAPEIDFRWRIAVPSGSLTLTGYAPIITNGAAIACDETRAILGIATVGCAILGTGEGVADAPAGIDFGSIDTGGSYTANTERKDLPVPPLKHTSPEAHRRELAITTRALGNWYNAHLRADRFKTADTERTVTTLSDDPHLYNWGLKAGRSYKVEGFLYFTQDASASQSDAKVRFDFSGTVTTSRFALRDADDAPSPSVNDYIMEVNTTTTIEVAKGQNVVSVITGFIRPATDGVLDFQWAQSTQDATYPVILHSDSWLHIEAFAG